MSDVSEFRSRAIADRLIGISISYERDNLLSRGLGIEHLRELLLRLSRPLLRHSGSLAYGGHWQDTEDNFTFELLRLVSAERLDTSAGDNGGTPQTVGQLFCYSAWPRHYKISKSMEAQWMNCCRVLRISQSRAGLKQKDQLPKADPDKMTPEDRDKIVPRLAFNSAVTLSAMRRISMEGWYLTAADVAQEQVPPISARIVLGGKLTDYSGFAPGIFEEALVTMEARKPLYLLGGFGGATEVLAKAITDTTMPPEMALGWHLRHTPKLKSLDESAKKFGMPKNCRSTEEIFDALAKQIREARADPAGVLNTGLDDAQTRELLQTRSIDSAVYLVFSGFVQHNKLPDIAV